MIKGFACGVFDLFHAGHVLMLQECKQHCDYLVVAINTANQIDYSINPNKKPPIYSFEDRKLIIESCRFVDEVIGYSNENELSKIMEQGNFSIRFLGEDYRGKPITAPNAIQQIFYTDRSHNKSTTAIKNLIKRFD